MSAYAFRDDSEGSFPALDGSSIDYEAGTLTVGTSFSALVPVPQWRRDDANQRFVFSHWTYETQVGTLPVSANIIVEYSYGDALSAANETFTGNQLFIDLTPNRSEDIVPGSVRLRLGGKTLIDRLGSLYADVDPATGSGVLSGNLDYSSGLATLTAWAAGGNNTPDLPALCTRLGSEAVDEITFRTPAAPIRSGSLFLQATLVGGGTVSATADSSGVIAAAKMEGSVDYTTGVVHVRFGEMVTAAGNEGEPWYDANQVVDGEIWKPAWVYADTVRFNAVVVSYLPLDADILGLDPVRLPSDGRVPIFRKGDVVVVHHTDTVSVETPVAGGTVDCERSHLARVWVKDSTGAKLSPDKYSVDLEGGILTWANPLDLSDYTGPYTVYHRIENMALASDVEISGRISLTRALTHDFPEGALVSSALIIGDMQARWTNLFTQQTWTNVWQDSVIGSETTAQYNTLDYPLIVTNDGAIQERWALIFTSSTAYRCVGENVGQIAEGISINEDFSPINPATGQPYFTILAAGFGSGWSAGNVIRFNTLGANFPVWCARTILQSNPTVDSDSFTIQVRGDADA